MRRMIHSGRKQLMDPQRKDNGSILCKLGVDVFGTSSSYLIVQDHVTSSSASVSSS